MSEKMDPELKAKWAAALRSGKYKQGSGALRVWDEEYQETTYCCLGVLGEVGGFKDTGFLLEGEDTPLTLDQQGFLALLNDAERWDFDRIADFIEAFL